MSDQIDWKKFVLQMIADYNFRLEVNDERRVKFSLTSINLNKYYFEVKLDDNGLLVVELWSVDGTLQKVNDEVLLTRNYLHDSTLCWTRGYLLGKSMPSRPVLRGWINLDSIQILYFTLIRPMISEADYVLK